MKLKFIGHSCFLVTSSDGATVIIDPYKSGAYGGAICYDPIIDQADIAVLTHEHEDHGNVKDLPGHPLSVSMESRVRGIEFDMVMTWHDQAEGAERGPNRIVCFSIDDIRLCHLGDLGHVLKDEQASAVGHVDILLVPVGGRFTIGPDEASEVIGQLKPRIVVPMHYKTDKCLFPIEPVDTFLNGKEPVRRSSSSEVIFTRDDLPGRLTYLYIPPSN